MSRMLGTLVLERKTSQDVTMFISNTFSDDQNAHSVTGLLMCAQCLFFGEGKVALFTI